VGDEPWRRSLLPWVLAAHESAIVNPVDVVLANNDRVTVRVDDVFLKIDADPQRSAREVHAMSLAPVPTAEVLWHEPPVLALGALRGAPVDLPGQASIASPGAWAAVGVAIRRLHEAPLPPWTAPYTNAARWASVETLAASLAQECEWLTRHEVLSAEIVDRNRRRAENVLRQWRPAFIHGDLHVMHVFTEGESVTGILDWSEAAPGDATFDLASLTLAHPERLDDVLTGYGDDIDRSLVEAWWSYRCLTGVRWLVENGYGPPEEYPEVAMLRSTR
jgi:aminoglycoside phosphotransferase (APT) family kinase protein